MPSRGRERDSEGVSAGEHASPSEKWSIAPLGSVASAAGGAPGRWQGDPVDLPQTRQRDSLGGGLGQEKRDLVGDDDQRHPVRNVDGHLHVVDRAAGDHHHAIPRRRPFGVEKR